MNEALILSAVLIAWPAWLPPGVDLNTALRPLNAALLIGLALGGGAAARALSISTPPRRSPRTSSERWTALGSSRCCCRRLTTAIPRRRIAGSRVGPPAAS